MRDASRLATLGAVLVLAACGGSGSSVRRVVVPDHADLASEGRRIYLDACAPCHGTSGTGDGPVAASLKRRPTDLTRLAARAGGTFPDGLVVDTLAGARAVPAHGDREMPVWSVHFGPTGAPGGAAGIYAERRTNALIAFLGSIQRSGGEVR